MWDILETSSQSQHQLGSADVLCFPLLVLRQKPLDKPLNLVRNAVYGYQKVCCADNSAIQKKEGTQQEQLFNMFMGWMKE